MNKKYVIALDQGTTSSRAVIFNKNISIIGLSQKEFTQIYPKPGYVEHDAKEILETQIEVLKDVVKTNRIAPSEISAIGITNQRETTVVWDKLTGEPVYNAIVWQCRRTAGICEELVKNGYEEYIKNTTGLVIDAYFSATKIKWILENVEGAKEKAIKGDLLFGNIDTWLIWNLTKGELHITDYSNASRTMLYDINNLCWDEKLLELLGIPKCMMPEVVNSSQIYGNMHASILGEEVVISGIAGDQQSALFGQMCFHAGMVKNTYGTGCFLLMNTGKKPVFSKNGLLTTIAWGINGDIQYALEGSVFIGGAAVQWLRDELRVINESSDSEFFAKKVDDTNGVYFVPAFSGLGAPYWDMYARGSLMGLTRGANVNHIIRATLESIAYQSKDVIDAMISDSGINLNMLKVDGGATKNDFLMQFQADILHVDVDRPIITETTALGAAFLAGLATGFWKSKGEIAQNWTLDKKFKPEVTIDKSKKLYNGWLKAVDRSKHWIEIEE